MKKTTTLAALLICLAFCFTACGPSIKLVGEFNMISTRNVSMKESYTVIKSYAGEGRRDLDKNKASTMDGAVNNLVRSVPGGEFIMNAKIYVIDNLYYSVGGDVYGLEAGQNYKGFKKGQRVQWKSMGVRFQGKVVNLKSSDEITVETENGVIKNFSPDELTIIE